MIRVVDYCRVSTEEEKQKNALKTQIEENHEFIISHEDWDHVDTYIDEGKTATTTKGRNDFKRLVSDMKEDKFDVILIKIVDRAWRNSKDWKDFEYMLMTNDNVRLFIKSRNAFYDYQNPTDHMATGMEAQFAEWFSINQSIKMNQAHQTRMRKGTVVTNGKTWGYNQIKGQLVINEEEAEIVRFIFNAYASGKGFRTIKNELNKLGIANKNGNEFSLTTLKRIIKNEKYKGTLICGKRHKDFWTKKYKDIPSDEWVIHENAIPAIVSVELWEEANAVLGKRRVETGFEEKRKIYGYFNGSYSYSGRIKCGKCGAPYYHSIYTTGKNKDKKLKTWECKSYREHGKKEEVGGCDNVRIMEAEMDCIIKQAVYMFWENKDDTIDEAISILNEALSNGNDKSGIARLSNDKKRIEFQKEKLLELYADETISKSEFKERNDKFTNQIENINKSISELESKNQVIADKKERLIKFKEFFNTRFENKDGLNDEIVNEFLDEIVVKPDSSIDIILSNNNRFVAKKDGDDYSFARVTDMGPDRHAYRDHAG